MMIEYCLRNLIGMLVFLLIIGCQPEFEAAKHNPEHDLKLVTKDSIRSFWDHFRNGTDFRISGKWNEAAMEYSQALRLKPNHEDALFYLGNMHYEMENYTEAERYWQELAALNPLSVKARYQLGNLYFSHDRKDFYDLEKAKEEFMKAHRINKVITGPQMLLARILLIRKDYQSARKYFTAVMGSDPGNMEASFLMGYISWKLGNINKSQEYYMAAITFAADKKPVMGTLSEGDTRPGRAFFSPLEKSIFNVFIQDLGQMEMNSVEEQMREKYTLLEKFLEELNQE
jgi:tetratricopeptide (TPR) repeat protein